MDDETKRRIMRPGPQPCNQIAMTFDEQMKLIEVYRIQAAERRRREEWLEQQRRDRR